MPTYVYRRPDGTTFDHFQKISDAPLTTDPETGDPVTRVISGGAGLQFKGDGFYLTDYVRKKDDGSGDKKKKTAASGESAPAKAEPAKSEASKPAPTTTTDG